MTTHLAANPVPDPAQLALIADGWTPLAIDFADAFEAACHDDALAHSGLVHPSRVSALLHERLGDFDPRRFSAMWAPACGRDGFLDKTGLSAPIDPEHSRGNSNKTVRLRRLRDFPAAPIPPGHGREQTSATEGAALGKSG